MTSGLHHVTAIAGDANRNLDFYAGTLGLRLVKRTVNFDDPGTYHLYFGDGSGRPGSIITFFPWSAARAGRLGVGQPAAIALSIAPASLGYWVQRLLTHGVTYEGPRTRHDEQVIAFRDPDGIAIELVAHAGAAAHPGWDGGPVPAEETIRGVHGVTLWTAELDASSEFLTGVMGFRAEGERDGVRRFVTGDGGPGTIADLRDATGFWRGTTGAGTIHHVAWRARDAADQLAIRDAVLAGGAHPTQVLDRRYFQSVYFHEPGGVLFEIATDAPGFAIDEPFDSLGTSLMLPPWLEPRRRAIEESLAPLHVPGLPALDEAANG